MTRPIDPTGRSAPTRILERLRFGLREDVPYEQLERTLTLDRWQDFIADRFVLRLRTEVLAERLPDQDLHGYVTTPRWATWRDHLKDTYRTRWWMRWWVRHHPVRYVDEPHLAHINVQAWWKYPHTPLTILPGQGYSTIHTETGPVSWGLPPLAEEPPA